MSAIAPAGAMQARRAATILPQTFLQANPTHSPSPQVAERGWPLKHAASLGSPSNTALVPWDPTLQARNGQAAFGTYCRIARHLLLIMHPPMPWAGGGEMRSGPGLRHLGDRHRFRAEQTRGPKAVKRTVGGTSISRTQLRAEPSPLAAVPREQTCEAFYPATLPTLPFPRVPLEGTPGCEPLPACPCKPASTLRCTLAGW
jgi:hypothetical protein